MRRRGDLRLRRYDDTIGAMPDSTSSAAPITLATTGARMRHLRQLHARGELNGDELQLLADYYLEDVEPPAQDQAPPAASS